MLVGSNNTATRCLVRNCDAAGTNYGFGTGQFFGCTAIGNGLGYSGSSAVFNCGAYDNSSDGFSGVSVHVNSLASGNGGDGFDSGAVAGSYTNCTADGNTASGFKGTVSNLRLTNCVSTFNGAYGYDVSGSSNLTGCASLTNTSGRRNGGRFDINPILLSADPYVNRAGDDFRPNKVAGGGALLRNTAFDVGGQDEDSKDVGAVHHSSLVAALLLLLGVGS
jgi:hypothetical protein